LFTAINNVLTKLFQDLKKKKKRKKRKKRKKKKKKEKNRKKIFLLGPNYSN
jgi:ribosome-associated translation inhibitor RaiA